MERATSEAKSYGSAFFCYNFLGMKKWDHLANDASLEKTVKALKVNGFNVFVVNQEVKPERITILLIKEKLGF